MAVKILCGGLGSERLVSVASAQNVARHWPEAALLFWSERGIHELEPGELQAHAEPFTRQLVPRSPPRHASLDALASALANDDVLFVCLHGRDGESGELQARLDVHGVAYTGSGAEASRLAYEKPAAKRIAAEHGVAVAESVVCTSADFDAARPWLQTQLRAGHALFAKPCADGSSVGLHKLKDEADLDRFARELSRDAARRYLVERAVVGRELTVGVVEWASGLEALPCSEVVMQGASTFGYEEKYVSAAALEITPAELPAEVAARAKELATRMHRALGCRGYSRTDCILSGDALVFLELNTLPGLTARSFLTQQLAAAGHDFRAFLERQVAIARQARLGDLSEPT